MRIFHGGRIHNHNGENRRYVGGEVCYVDGVDPDRIAWTLLNSWAYDLGYEHGYVNYWYKLPHAGAEFRPLTNDIDVMDMVGQIPASRNVDLFIVTMYKRREFNEEEVEVYNEVIDHINFMVPVIPDIEDGDGDGDALRIDGAEGDGPEGDGDGFRGLMVLQGYAHMVIVMG